jgi:putative CocE/NonD family hydrolase
VSAAPRHVWIPLADGCRLSARLWPAAADGPAPAVIEYIPYRKDDITAPLDHSRMAWFAEAGYACLRIDLRGSGDSDGLLADEYLAQEQDDAVEAIAWIAGQDWCSGAVGMIGYSWGGFNGLQVAARRPPALRAVISLMSTDDRYGDDVHYIGGSLLADTQHSWATSMLVYAALPPDPAVVGEGWREQWLARVQGVSPMIEPWMTHQRRDGYWRHGSVGEGYAIECPVMLVGGWSDGYRDAVLRMLEGLSVPRRGLIGPWSHAYPHDPVAPGPAIGFLQECRRWWDEWLKGEPSGVRDEPMLLAWMQEPAPAQTFYAQRPGRWVAEPAWPPAQRPTLRLALGAGNSLGGAAGGIDHVAPSEATGLEGGFWCPFGNRGDWAPDQRGEEAASLCYTSAPLEQRLELLGRPLVRLRLAADRPLAQLAVRLNAVSEDGSSAVLTRGMLNLTHRRSHAQPEPLEPGRFEEVEIRLQSLGQVVEAGQRLRLAISTGYWPWLWPSPERATVSVDAGGESWLELPERSARAEDEDAGPCPRPASAPQLPHRFTRVRSGERTVERDGVVTRLTHLPHDFALEIEGGSRVDWSGPDVYSIADGDPLSAAVESSRRVAMEGDGWDALVEVRSSMRSDAGHFLVETSLRASSGGATLAQRDWRFRIARDLV